MFSGPRRGPNSSGAGNIVIELLDEGISADTHDVDFGGRSMRPPRPDSAGQNRAGKILAVATFFTVLIGSVIWLAQREDEPSTDQAAPTPTTTEAAVDESVPQSSEPPGNRDVVVTTTALPNGPFLVDVRQSETGITDDLSVYLTDEALTDVYRVNMNTGFAQVISEGDSGLGTVTGIAGTPTDPVVVRSPFGGWTAFRPGPQGTYWEQRNDEVRLVQPGVEDVIRQVSAPWVEPNEYSGIYLVGTSQSGEPVVGGPDNRFYELLPDGSARLFSESWPRDLVLGNFMTVICSEAATCSQRIQTTVGSFELPFPKADYFGSSTFTSPNGRWVIHNVEGASGYTTVLIDVVNGVAEDIDFGGADLGRVDFAGGDGSGQVFRSLWSQDSRYFISRLWIPGAPEEQLMVLNVDTGVQTMVPGLEDLLPIAVM